MEETDHRIDHSPAEPDPIKDKPKQEDGTKMQIVKEQDEIHKPLPTNAVQCCAFDARAKQELYRTGHEHRKSIARLTTSIILRRHSSGYTLSIAWLRDMLFIILPRMASLHWGRESGHLLLVNM